MFLAEQNSLIWYCSILGHFVRNHHGWCKGSWLSGPKVTRAQGSPGSMLPCAGIGGSKAGIPWGPSGSTWIGDNGTWLLRAAAPTHAGLGPWPQMQEGENGRGALLAPFHLIIQPWFLGANRAL